MTMIIIIFLSLLLALCNSFAPPSLPASRSQSISSLGVASSMTQRDMKVQQVLDFARQLGPIGMDASQEDQDKLVAMSKDLVPYSDPKPGLAKLSGVYDMVYSASKGASAGRIKIFGKLPVDGSVQQEFLDPETFVNSVSLGPFTAALTANRVVENDTTNEVVFLRTKIQILGQTLVEKEVNGGGFWEYLFMGTITDKDGIKKFVRIMETPSLFVLEQEL